MKHTLHIFFISIILTSLFGCNDLGNTDNPMFGKTYTNASELPEFKGYEEWRSSVVEGTIDKDGNYKLGLTYLKKNNTHVLILEEITKPDEKGKVSYKILDTICIKNAKDNQRIEFNNCMQNDTYNDKLVAFLTKGTDDKQSDKIIKAWLIDIRSARFSTLKDVKGITSIPEDEGCGYDEYEVEVEDLTTPDTTVNVITDTVINQSIDSLPTNE